VGQHGAALALSGDPALGSVLTYATRAPDSDSPGVVERAVPLEPGARAVLLAGDGGAYAAVVYVFAAATARDGTDSGRSATAACRLALVDLRSGAVEAAHTVCGPGDLPTGLAMETTAAGPVAYFAMWSRASQGSASSRAAGARIVAVQAKTGAMLATVPLAGLPRPVSSGGSLLLAPGPNGSGRRLYCVASLPNSEIATWDEQEYEWQSVMSGAWRIMPLTPDRLVAERAIPWTSPRPG
jgi:hypothetical protein